MHTPLADRGGGDGNFGDAQENIAAYVADYGVGIDCHSRFIQVCVITRQGQSIHRLERAYATTWEELCEAREWVLKALSQALEERAPNQENLSYCAESTGAYHYPLMLSWGGFPAIVNPLLAKAGQRKTDKIDARMLAKQMMMGTWRPSYVAPLDVEVCRLALNQRRRLVRERCRLTNALNNIVLRFGHTFVAHRTVHLGGSSGLSSPKFLPVFEALSVGKLPKVKGISPIVVPAEAQLVMRDMIARVNDLNREVRRQSARVEAAVRRTEFVTKGGELVLGGTIMDFQRTVPGCGPLVTATWLSQIADASRFKTARQVSAFCGFDPSIMVSAGKVTSHMRRKGNVFLHYMIKTAARRVINLRKEALGQWGYALSKRHRTGGYNKAVGAVGRKIATGLWICHRDLVTWSYDSYDFWRPPDVPDVELKEVGFSPQVLRILAEKGYATSGQSAYGDNEGRRTAPPTGGAQERTRRARRITSKGHLTGAGSASATPSGRYGTWGDGADLVRNTERPGDAENAVP